MQKVLSFLQSRRHHIAVAIALLACCAAVPYIFRSLWFDEVLTMEVFVRPQRFWNIYWAYNIPNNHIIFSLCEKLWTLFIALIMGEGFCMPFLYRMVSLAFAIPAVILFTEKLMDKCGILVGAIVGASLCISTTFILFSTCIRGYMLSFFFTVFAFYAAEKIVKYNRKRDYFLYFAACILSVGTIPANLAALGAVALFFLPTLFFHRKRIWSSFFLCFLPVLALIVFYTPIARKFFANMDRGEGWTSPAAAATNLYFSFAVMVLMLLPFALLGGVHYFRKHYRKLKWHFAAGVLIFLLPVPAFFVFKNAAFPRVFFPLFPVWGMCIGLLLAMYWKSCKTAKGKWAPILLQIFSLILLLEFAPQVSDFVYSSGRDDDLTMPYHLRHTFSPPEMLGEIKERLDRGEKLYVFATFHSDAPANAYEVMLRGLPPETVRTDAFGGFWEQEIVRKKEEGYNIYFLTGSVIDLEYNIRRFGFSGSEPVLIRQYQRLDRIY